MVRFEQGLFDRIEALADKRNCKPSDVIRAAVVAYVADSALDATSHRRLARISEFLQLAVLLADTLNAAVGHRQPSGRLRRHGRADAARATRAAGL